MRVAGSAVLHAPADVVYATLNDPSVLSATIPGCRSLTALGPHRYAMSVTAGVASITGTYQGEVELTDQRPPGSFVLRAKGSGTPGTVDTTVQVTLTDDGQGRTRLDYAADAAVGGMIGGVGQRMLAGVAKKMAGQFFADVDEVLTGSRAPLAPAPAQPTPLSPSGDHAIPVQGATRLHDHRGVGGRAAGQVAAFVTGAAVALAGVAVGVRLAGRGERQG